MKEIEEAGTEDLFSIQMVSRRTGLSPEVLRVWEKRYKVVLPIRTATGRRMYSTNEVERLKLLRMATLSGRRISQIADLNTDELLKLTQEDLRAEQSKPTLATQSNGTSLKYVETCMRLIDDLDGAGLHSELMQALAVLNGMEFVEDFLAVLFERIGNSWVEGDLDPNQEHMATAIVRGILSQLFTTRHDGGPTLVIATPVNHRHEVGALLAAVTASFVGYKVVYLGADLPAESIEKAVKSCGASAVALSVVYPEADEETIEDLKNLSSLLPQQVSVIMGGNAAAGYAESMQIRNLQVVESFRDMDAALRRIRLE